MNRDPEEIDEIERMIASSDGPIPSEVESRMRARLFLLQSRIEGISRPSKEHWLMQFFRNKRQGLGRWATIAALSAIAVMVAWVSFGDNSTGTAYAAAVRQLRSSLTSSFHMVFTGIPGMPEMSCDVYRKGPGSLRMEMHNGDMSSIAIVNISERKLLSLVPAVRRAIVMNLGNIGEKTGPHPGNYLQLADELHNLPAQADEAMFGELDGRRMRIYLIRDAQADKYLWLDDATGRVERFVLEFSHEANKPRAVMTDFKFDQPLDDAFFSTTPPADYTLVEAAGAVADLSAFAEKDLLTCLDFCREGGVAFPAVLDPARPMESAQLLGQALGAAFVVRARQQTTINQNEIEQQAMRAGMLISRGMMFLGQMKPENDWHYAGNGKTPGNAADWIAWYKPDGAQNYRVIHGDLSVTEVTPAEATAHANK